MGGIDGYDWSPFGGNPAPGDPEAVRGMATRLGDLADSVAMQNRLLQAVASDSESIWVGPAASAFRPHVAKLPGQLDKLTGSYRDAADALDGYWPRLQSAQQLAVEALLKYHAAEAQLSAARAASAQADSDAGAAASAYNHAANQAATAPPDPSGATAVNLSVLQSAYQAATARQSAAAAQVASAAAAVAAARALAAQARTQARTAASTAAGGLHAASNAGIHNPHHSWLSGIVDGVEGVFTGATHWVEHHASEIEFAASLALGPVGLMLTSEGRHLAEEALKDSAPFLQAASAGLGILSAGLAVAGLVLAPVGVGEVIDAVNEGLMVVKAADDGLLLADGAKGAESALIEDGAAIATGGLGRLFGDTGDALAASGEVEKAQAEAGAAASEVSQSEQALADTRAAVEAPVADAAARGDLYSAMAGDLRQSNPFIANQLDLRAGEEADRIGAAQARVGGAEHDLAGAQAELGRSKEAVSEAESTFRYHEQYNPIGSQSSLTKSFIGSNNLSKLKLWQLDRPGYVRAFLDREGLSGSFGSDFVKYYKSNLFGAPNGLSLAGHVLHAGQQTINVYWGYKGVSEVPGDIHAVVHAF